jgi:CrcB protein
VIHLAVAAGGIAGAVLRHAVGLWLTRADGLPVATLATNLCGALVLGVLMGRLASSTASPAVRAGLTIGLCGGFTTFSTFAYEVVALARDARTVLAVLYLTASLGLGTTAMFAGLFAGTALARGWPGVTRHAPQAGASRGRGTPPEAGDG